MLKLSNNASGLLGSNLTAGATSLTLASGHGARFPTVSSGEWYPVTIVSAADPANFEIVRVTARNVNTLTISRAQEGTTAKAFSAGDVVELRMTAGAYDQGFAKLTDNNGTKGLMFSVAGVPNGQTRTFNLGSAAEIDVTVSNNDVTPGRVLKVGDFGLGRSLPVHTIPGSNSVNRAIWSGFYTGSTDTVGFPSNFNPNGSYILTASYGDGQQHCAQLLINRTGDNIALRRKVGGNWNSHVEIYHSGNFNPNDYVLKQEDGTTQLISTSSQKVLQLNSTGSEATTFVRGVHGGVLNWYVGKTRTDSDNVVLQSEPLSTNLYLTSGGVVSNKNVTAFSDERLKENWNTLPDNFVEQLALVKTGSYDRKDTGIRQVGVSAQSLQKVLPEAVIESEESLLEGEESKLDFEGPVLSVSYGNAALAAAVELAKTVVSLKEQVASLAEEVKSLKEGKNG